MSEWATVWGILLPESILRSEAFAVLAAFVAINTVMYVALTVAKMLPKIYFVDLVTPGNRRRETRHIHPEAAVEQGRPGFETCPTGVRVSAAKVTGASAVRSPG